VYKIHKIKKVIFNKKNRGLILYILAALLLSIIAFIFRERLVSSITTLILIILGILSGQLKRLTGDMHIGIGFVPFANIMFLQTHGISFTIIASLIMMLSSSILVGNIRPHIFITYFIFLGLIFLSYFIHLPTVFATSMTLLLIYNIVGFFIMTGLGWSFSKNFIYSVGSSFFNYFLFKYFGDIVYHLLL